MRTIRTIVSSVSAVCLVLSGLAPLAARAQLAGAVTSIEMRDWNQNGKIDRAVISVSNPSNTSWSVRNSSGLKIAAGGVDLALTHVFIASAPTADPVLIEAVIDESDPNLPKTTSSAAFEVSYLPTSDLSGISDGTSELQRIETGDAGLAANTEVDKAAPILISSTPAPGTTRVSRSADITFTFSEPMSEGSFSFETEVKPGDWIVSWNAASTKVTLVHTPYGPDKQESITVSAQDLAGNALVADSYPNPLAFRTTSDDDLSPFVQPSFLLVSPAEDATVYAGTPTVVGWYTDQAAAEVRLSYSVDAGSSYHPIGLFPVDATAVWYPPNAAGNVILKAETLGANGIPVNIAVGRAVIAVPTEKPVLRVVAAPMVSETTDVSAVISLMTDAAPATIALSCDSPVGNAELTASRGRPTSIAFALTGLVKDASYRCTAVLTDIFGTTVEASAPVFIASAAGDVTPPILLEATVDQFNLGLRTARLSWKTDEPSTYEISYGAELNYGNKLTGNVLNTSHAVTLTGLTPGALHQARITMLDAKGNAAVGEEVRFAFLADGSLVKGETSSAVYWFVGGKRYVFPHERVYRSWFADFSRVVTIPGDQLASMIIGGNVQVRAGTALVKIQSDPKVYAVESGGRLRPIASEAQAAAIYGADWAGRVRDIDVSFFINYRVGAELADGEWPDGYLARTPSNGKVWLIAGDSIRHEITPDAMSLNGLDASYTMTVDENSAAWNRLSVGSAVQSRDARLHVVWGNAEGDTAITP